MKRFTILSLVLMSVLSGITPPAGRAQDADPPAAYLSFVINTHDWMHPADSAQIILNLIDLFESHGVRGDFYLTAPTARVYADDYPEGIERLCESEMTISYHIRPPNPIHSGFDTALSDLEGQALYDAVYATATQRLDMETGELIPGEVGGYLYVAQLCGRDPVSLGLITRSPAIRTAALQVYADLGARMIVEDHENNARLERRGDLWTRPSDFSVTRWRIDDVENAAFWWNMLDTPHADEYDPVAYLQTQITAWQESHDRPAFITVLIHENSFYRQDQTPWQRIFWDRNGQPLPPPYDLSGPDASNPRSTENQALIWETYSALVAYVAATPSIAVVTSADIVQRAEAWEGD